MAIKQVHGEYTYIGPSTETKPVGIPAGSKFIEFDTGAKYITDGQSWMNDTTNNTGISNEPVTGLKTVSISCKCL